MDVLHNALRFVTGLPQPVVPAPIPNDIFEHLPSLRTVRKRGRRGYGLDSSEDGRRVTRARAQAAPVVATAPAPAATGAQFAFNPVIPQAAVGMSRTLSANAEQQRVRETQRGTPKRKRMTRRTKAAPKPRLDINQLPDDVIYRIMHEVGRLDPAFGPKALSVCRRWKLISPTVPSLWSHIVISGPSSFPRAAQNLKHAEGSPITVYLRNLSLQEVRNDQYFFHGAVRLVEPHRQCMTSLTIRTHSVSTLRHALRELVDKETVALRTLDISICTPVPQRPDSALLTHRMPRSIETIRFDRVILTHIGSRRHLRNLHISRPEAWTNNLRTLRTLAAVYPYLRTLRIDNWGNQLIPEPFDGVRDIVWTELEELRLWKCRSDNVVLFLQHFASVSLTTVDIALNSVPYQQSENGYQELHNSVLRELHNLQTFMISSKEARKNSRKGVRALSLAGMQTNLWELFMLLRSCTGMRTLAFTHCNITNDTLNWLSNPAMSASWLCPELERLKIEECAAVEGYAVRQLAFNRWLGAENEGVKQFQELGIRCCSRVSVEDVKFCRLRVPKVDFSI
ncbi:hypothetical protein DACRYDRAFT_119455 [Dacryopinax primogenitus]|uniref:F-box domain-containing protein n=1 Tax=Dacryopinax primogenitus (strain DJM 731) TaxID=1858805 RepID=M5FVH7_DACPD|nr:uncharacterized protein DACRYDRAFT_119455 [Dacryopinax primogenitus]EJT97336.1 hypothetical protein DACRYDRAFT_119455 [Dacryopinax primogenitus]